MIEPEQARAALLELLQMKEHQKEYPPFIFEIDSIKNAIPKTVQGTNIAFNGWLCNPTNSTFYVTFQYPDQVVFITGNFEKDENQKWRATIAKTVRLPGRLKK